MALSYTGSTGIFTTLGSVVAAVNACQDELDDWTDNQTLIQDSFELAEQQDAEAPLLSIVDQIQQSIASTRESMGQICTLRLQDFASLVEILGIPSDDIGSILFALIRQMVADAASVAASTVTIGAIAAGSGNVGNGTIMTTGTLDGASIHTASGIAHPNYLGRSTELALAETMTLRCTQDSYTDGATAGQETFTINGLPLLNGAWAFGTPGSGTGPSLATVQDSTILSNTDFETFTETNIPDNWTIATGTVNTNVARDAVTFYRGTYAVKLIGTGAAASISLTQPISLTSVTPLKRYCVSFRYKASAAEGAGGKTLTVILTGTGYAAGATESVAIAGVDLLTAWTLRSFFVNLPANVPSDLKISIAFTGTPTVTVSIDDCCMAEVVWWNGIGFAAVAGSAPFVDGDSFTTAITNSEGLFQGYFRREYGIQLPSLASGSNTISDGLAS